MRSPLLSLSSDSAVPSVDMGSPDGTKSPNPVAVSCSPALAVPTTSTAGSAPAVGPPSSPFRVYSPSETATWLQCPILRGYKKHWTPRTVAWDPAKLLGIAVQEGLSVWLRASRASTPGTGDEATDEAVESRLRLVLSEGFQEQPTHTLAGLTKLALRGVQATLNADLFDRHTILMVDEPLSQSRPDVVSRHATEGLGVTDFKVSRTVGEQYRAKRLSEYETDDQFWHYAWEVGETLGEPVQWIRAVLIILAPAVKVMPITTPVGSRRLAFWLAGAEQHWRDMTAEDHGQRAVAPRWPNCRGGRYGECEMYDACHVLHGDESKFLLYYERTH